MIAILRAELHKLRGSLAMVLMMVAPAFPALVVLLSSATAQRAFAWGEILGGFMLPIWAVFLLPMAVTAMTTLLAQIEYQASGWDHLFALPVPRTGILLAKTVVTFLMVAVMTLLAVASSWAAGHAGGWWSGQAPTGAIDPFGLGRTVALLLLSSLFLVAVQLWVSLRYANFVVGMATGIGGTMVGLAVAMTGTGRADWFPWVLPIKSISAETPADYATTGLVGALVVSAIMVVDLSRRTLR